MKFQLPVIALALALLAASATASGSVFDTGSQYGQDAFVMAVYDHPKFYLDVGSNDGEVLSNTLALDKAGWKGICIDPFPTNYERRTCTLHQGAVFGYRRNVTFKVEGVYGGIQDTISGVHKNSQAPTVTLETDLLESLLDKYNAPSFIEYMSLDVEGAEYEIMRSFPWWKYTFGVITVEHNYEEPKRTDMRTLLQHQGYVWVKEQTNDDIYMFKRIAPASLLNQSSQAKRSRHMALF